MQKTDILGKLAEFNFTQDVTDAIQQELTSYSDEMSDSDVKSFDAFLNDLQMSEMAESQHLDQLADFFDQAIEQNDQNIDNFAHDNLKAMKTSLSHAQDLSNMVE